MHTTLGRNKRAERWTHHVVTPSPPPRHRMRHATAHVTTPRHCSDQVTIATATHVTSTRPYSRRTATMAVSSGELNPDSHPNLPMPIADDGCRWCLHVRSRLQAACLHAACLRASVVCRWQVHHSTTTHALVPPHVVAVAPAVVAERDGAGAPGMLPGALPCAASPASPAPISDDGQATAGQAVAVALNDTEWPIIGALRPAGAPRTPLAPIAPTRVDLA